MTLFDCCQECLSDKDILPDIRKKQCCCVCMRESERLSKEYYDQKWKDSRRAFVRFLHEDPKNIRVFTGKLRELNDELEVLKAARYAIYKVIPKNYYEELKKRVNTIRIEESIEVISKQIREIDFAKKVCQGKIKELDDTMLLQAKAVPINLFIGSAEDRHGSERSVFTCPIHQEKTASFTWYKKQNKWHCFGCEKNGDAIDLYMALHNVSFTKAVRELAEGRY